MPTFKTKCYNPEVQVTVTDNGMGNLGLGEAVSQTIQFNVNIPPGQGVIFVDPNNLGILQVTIEEGYRIVDGRAEPDVNNVSSDNSDFQPPRPAATAIIGATRISFHRMSERFAQFAVEPLTNFLNGTMNVKFFIKYTKVQ